MANITGDIIRNVDANGRAQWAETHFRAVKNSAGKTVEDLDNEVSALDQEKIDISTINLIDPDKCEANKGWKKSTSAPSTNSGGRLTDYIPVNGQNIISNGLFNANWCGAVFDANKTFLRNFEQAQYTYQSGDAYIRLSISSSVTDAMANYGTTLLGYQPYNPVDRYIAPTVQKVNNQEISLVGIGTHLDAAIDASGVWQNASGNYASLLIPVKENDALTVWGNPDNDTSVHFLNSYTAPARGVSADRSRYAALNESNRKRSFTVASGEHYICITTKYTTDRTPRRIIINDWDIPLSGDVKNLKWLADEELTFDVATGGLTHRTALADDADGLYVGAKAMEGKQTIKPMTSRIIAFGHDDLPRMDYIATRKLYNKYGFTGTFNFILTPFSSASVQKDMVEGVRKMIADGNHIGFHAVLGTSFFWRNPLFDITPSGGATFAPTITELRGSNQDGTGTNTFGDTVTATTKYSGVGFSNVPSSLSSVQLLDDDPKWFDVISAFTLYGRTASIDTVSGLDLDGASVSKGRLEWLEYWLNELIDSSYGYSTISGTVAERFAADYDDPTKYPDATHIANGKMVHYQDTTNPNYSDASYQKVGKFTKGLFKGCFSCCNYEAVDRCIKIAQAFVQYYFGLAKFDNMAYHGAGYFNRFWADTEGTLYADRDKAILATGYTPLLSAEKGGKVSLFDVLLDNGIKINKRNYPNDPTKVAGQVGLYLGQDAFRGPYFNDFDDSYHTNNYLSMIGETAGASGMAAMDYTTFMGYAAGHDDWLKWAVEEAGNDISGNGTMYMLPYVKETVTKIVAALGTGKIPFFGVDTIGASASIAAAVETVLRFCYENDITVMSPVQAREICSRPRMSSGNMFPNPGFERTLLKALGGSTSAAGCTLPDGWMVSGGSPVCSLAVEDGRRYCRFSSESSFTVQTRVYGLPAGKYRLTVYVRTPDGQIKLGKKYNKDLASEPPTELWTESIGSETFAKYTYEFEIEIPYRNEAPSTKAGIFCHGYEENVAFIRFSASATASAGYIDIAEPSIVQIG